MCLFLFGLNKSRGTFFDRSYYIDIVRQVLLTPLLEGRIFFISCSKLLKQVMRTMYDVYFPSGYQSIWRGENELQEHLCTKNYCLISAVRNLS